MSREHSREVSRGIFWSNTHWWIVCLTIISVVRDHMSTPHQSHTGTRTCAPQTHHFSSHISFSTWDLIFKTKRNRHICPLPLPHNRDDLFIFTFTLFHTHTQRSKENQCAHPHPLWLCQCFRKLISSVWHSSAFGSMSLSYSHLGLSIITTCVDSLKKCEHSKGHKEKINEVQGYFKKVFIDFYCRW